ncbi:MAG: hypothetical protein DWQ31_14680 [Planctomycetota bacterium]|nr:MAG: hypothetical protein DWQ31_14680 [Planctomycetota bacterium]REJ96085.1 MAG: hypothetical protein DWQ35_05080 [Planctomycetota bacterium]REK21857.1 MAG: hypothetical protein DWQ42_18410 [Planctomycetota bacterium]REK46665.1 MAG: hypothetical protein DWQ46_06095 [Planctomycetota bacterium]
MRLSRVRKRLLVAIVAILVLGGGGWATYRAARHVPQFYSEALVQRADTARTASGKMRRQMAALASDTQRTGSWTETFTVAEINGWLTVDLLEKHAGSLPPGVSNPRVSITPSAAQIGCQSDQPWPGMVYTITVEPYVAGPNLLAVRFRDARAGALPMPLGSIIDEVSAAAAESGVRLTWQQSDGDPVLLLPLAEINGSERAVLESIELTDGAIRFRGHTLSKEAARQQAAETERTGALQTSQSAAKQSRQR